MTDQAQRWNHNLHYHGVVLDALPADSELVLDVGCGEGILAAQLQTRGHRVTGIDRDEASIALARKQFSAVEFVCGNFLTEPFEPDSFDAVVSVAALHHMDTVAALGRMRELLRPGGRLVVIGCARRSFPRDLPREAFAFAANRWIGRKRTYWEHSAPIHWPPDETYRDMHRIASDELPGSRFRRHLLWRYSIVWNKPPS
jgi:SAM-dependent methyltransferase